MPWVVCSWLPIEFGCSDDTYKEFIPKATLNVSWTKCTVVVTQSVWELKNVYHFAVRVWINCDCPIRVFLIFKLCSTKAEVTGLHLTSFCFYSSCYLYDIKEFASMRHSLRDHMIYILFWICQILDLPHMWSMQHYLITWDFIVFRYRSQENCIFLKIVYGKTDMLSF